MARSLASQRIYAVARKELFHILRDPATLFMSLFIPICELLMLGYAIDTNVRRVSTVVLDNARTEESRALLRKFENSDDFRFVGEVFTDEALSGAIVAGEARVAIKIPEDYSRRLQAKETAQILVLVDGSESSIAAEIVNVSNALALRESLERVIGDRDLLVEVRSRVLFNPDTRSANFFIPGMLIVLCQMMAVMLTSNAIVREKANGTLEQLFMTPVRPSELILGKLMPYLALTFFDFFAIALLMRTLFGVPINGQFMTLVAIFLPFVLTMLGLGLGISTGANTREAAEQAAMATVIPSIFLSGYIFPIDSMPWFFAWFAQLIPTTWMIDASRGVILRGAGWPELWLHATVLWGMALAIFLLSVTRFHKRLS